MNAIRKSMSDIRASEELKQNTLRYLKEHQKTAKRATDRVFPIFRYALAAICLFLLFGTGGYAVYRKPVSYISIDVNPSIELGINRFDRVVSAEAYNEDGQDILSHVTLHNVPYIQAINKVLESESSYHFLKEDSLLIFTIVSDHSYSMIEELSANEFSQNYDTLMYSSDAFCMAEAHNYEMSFGRYRAYQELLQYDDSVTIEDCHNMTISELHNRVENCQHHGVTQNQEDTQDQDGSRHHGECHSHHN